MPHELNVMNHLYYLVDQLGPRPIGSDTNHAAAEYIREVFRSAGLGVEEQRYECPAWSEDETCLELNGKLIAAVANPFSLPCDVSLPIVAVGTVAELEAADLVGRIGVLYGELTREPLSAKSWFLKSERDDHVIQLLEGKHPVALITVQSRWGVLNRLIEDWEFNIPSATVPREAGLTLLRADRPNVHLGIASRQVPGYTANIVGRKPGKRAEWIVLCAHYDTKFDTPGACDNGTGVAVLLALAQLLGGQTHEYGIEFVAFTGEEYLPIGDDEYLRRRGERLDDVVAAINADGVAHYLGANTITMISSGSLFERSVKELTQNYPGLAWVEPWPESNHSTFSWRGVPSIAFSNNAAFDQAHMRTDTSDWVSPAKLEEIIAIISDVVGMLQGKMPEWTRSKSE